MPVHLSFKTVVGKMRSGSKSPLGFLSVLVVVFVALHFVFSSLRDAANTLSESDHHLSLVTTSQLLGGTDKSVILLLFRLFCAAVCVATTVTLLTDESPFEFSYQGKVVKLCNFGRLQCLDLISV